MGGTGILKPAALTLVRSGLPVTVVARGAQGDGAVAVDATDTQALMKGLDAAVAARGSFTMALVYAPFAPATSVAAIAARVPGVLVHVLTSRWAAPDANAEERDAWAPDGPGVTKRLLLGWAPGPRWHTPEEVSVAALAAAHGAEAERTLGATRPWADRPA